MCLTVRHIPVLAVWWMIGRLNNLVDYMSSIVLHLVHGCIGLLLLVGCYGLLCLGELFFRRLYRVVSACLFNDLFRRCFPWRLVLQRVSSFPDELLPTGLFCFAAFHIIRDQA